MEETASRLPEPGSNELRDLVSDANTRQIYAFLHRRRSHPPTMGEILAYMAHTVGETHAHTDRRLRSLRTVGFDVPAVLMEGEYRYPLRGMRPVARGQLKISKKTRAQILAPGRCAMCGKTPIDDQVKLRVDHKVPQAWGGGDEIENLQPLCDDCNGGKKDWFATYDHRADEIRAAINHDEVHRRIGELLKAFEGDWVFTELIGIVASAQAFQEDYQKRMRELRVLGWKIPHQNRRNEGARVRSYYKCTHWEPWPEDEPILTVIKRVEARKKAEKAAAKEAAG